MTERKYAWLTDHATLIDVLRDRAEALPEQRAYTFLLDGESDAQHLTYGELDLRARAIAALLQSRDLTGQRALLLYPPGLDYIAAFFGCLYASVVAVPAYPPQSSRPMPRIQAIATDAQAAVVLTTSAILAQLDQRLAQAPALAALAWLATDAGATESAPLWQGPAIDGATLAFLQYTSGSTATPKGVMLTHGNLLHNSALIHQAFGHSPSSRGVIWLPPYHDMGLIGGILQPLYGAFPVTLLSPVSFLQRPLRWLEAISEYGGTTSGGPNFAYELAVRRSTPEQRAALDLSRWTVAFTGAEPIRPATLERFAEAFAPAGFRREAFYPCYGLAEATLIVTGGRLADPPVIASFDADALTRHRVVETTAEDSRALVGCGAAFGQQQLAIADPETGASCAPGTVGEIWVRGPSVAQGYWGQPEASQATFGARLADTGAGPFLRTGDLGFLHDGQLFITGRSKELIIIRGRNHYPQDIELTVETSHPALRPGAGAAFSVEIDGEERLVVVQELDRRFRSAPIEPIVAAVRQAVAEQHELHVHAVALIKHGSLLKTSSGKIQRQAMRAAFLRGELELIGGDTLDHEAVTEAPAPDLDRAALLTAAPEQRTALLQSALRTRLAALLHIDPARIDPDQPLSALGLDSLGAVELQHTVEQQIGVVLALPAVLSGPSLAELSATILDELDAAPSNAAALAPRVALLGAAPLSYGQRALWFVQQLAPENAAYNIASAVRVSGPLDLAALERALAQLVERHAALRTTFAQHSDGPVQIIHAAGALPLDVVDAASWSAAQIQAFLDDAAQRPFDLERGPLLRIELLQRAPDESILLLVQHHIITDFWSLARLVDELGSLYRSGLEGAPAAAGPLALSMADYARWQAAELAGPTGERLWRFWQQQLRPNGRALPTLNLPFARPRPPVQTFVGAAHTITLSAALTDDLTTLSAQQGVTLYVTLLAAFQTLLHRYSGQDDIVIGSPSAGRTRAALADLQGYLINLLALRADFSDRPTFSGLLQQLRQTVRAGLAHQEYPFALLAEQLQPARDASRAPLVQVVFSLHQTPPGSPHGLAGIALGAAGAEIELAGLRLESLALTQRTAQFDLTLVMAEVAGRLTATFQYNTDLFEAAAIARLADHFETLLHGIVAAPEQPVATLPLLTARQLEQLHDWNATATPYPQEAVIHELFAAQAARTPEATALVYQDQALSYAELNERADRLARRLAAHGVGRGVPVGLCLGRSAELVVSMLAILKAGGCYVPLDPSYPTERLQFVVMDAQAPVLLTERRLLERLPVHAARIICVDQDEPPLAPHTADPLSSGAQADDLAYIIYTSGSTGQPKGVMLSHRGVINFFVGMDQRIGCDGRDTLLAVTSIAFDISVLELLWTLTRGARVVLLDEQAVTASGAPQPSIAPARPLEFSLFYFASRDRDAAGDAYRLLIEGAKFADRHGFSAVWTPERHFHAFGGLYPNPALTSAALATITERVQLRGGSVVMPLHHPLRVAEEWAVVDNLSRGRVGIAFASGWHSDDFAFFPQHYAARKQIMVEGIAAVQQLWRGESLRVTGGAGNPIDVRIYPQPIQPELPIWLTAGGSPETFSKAGELGANVLTHLLGQSIEELTEKIALYRASRAAHGHDPASGKVTLMLHTFIGNDLAAVRETVRAPFTNYLRSSVDLIRNLIASMQLPLDLNTMSPQDMDALLAYAFDRYFETSALFGTPQSCQAMLDRLSAIGVDEAACLIDFGVESEAALRGLDQIAALQAERAARAQAAAQAQAADFSLAAQARRYQATLLQGTPSLLRLLSLSPENLDALQGLRALLLGGEALPPALANELRQRLPARLINMYGPTETTIWSATHEVETIGSTVPIGRPIANPQLYVLDAAMQPLPVGVGGELYLGGDGLARGYWNRPALTAERFTPDPFGAQPGARLYRTGDLARWLPDGALEYLGRLDQQVKLRGFRIELEEIEAVLAEHPAVRAAVVVARSEAADADVRLVAYVVGEQRTENREHGDNRTNEPGNQAPEVESSALAQWAPLPPSALRQFLAERLPAYMIPSAFVTLDALPQTANGKIDRKALAARPLVADERGDGASNGSRAAAAPPRSALEQALATIWQTTLQRPAVGIHDNFFDLGGHSLLLAQVHSRLREELGVTVPMIALLEHPTISALAAYLAATERTPRSFQPSQDRARKQLDSLRRQRQSAKR